MATTTIKRSFGLGINQRVQLWSNAQPAIAPNLLSSTTDAEGLAVLLTFDVNMANPAAFASDFTVNIGGASVPIDRVALEIGTKIITVYPVDSFNLNEVVTISVASGNIKSASGGVLAAIIDESVTNNAVGTKYYVSNTGSDAADGKTQATAWQTMSKVNDSTFVAGDSILLKKGDTWRETLINPSNGSADHYIKIGNYGTGVKPRILGSTKLSSWVSGSIGGVAANNDILAESFEGTGYQNTWTESIGANNSIIDQDNTTAPFAGTQCLKMQRLTTPTATNAASALRTTHTFTTERPVTYMDYRVKISASNLAAGQREFLNYNNNTGGAIVSMLYLRNISGELKLNPQIATDGTGGTTIGALFPESGNITLDQWYQVQMKYDYTNLTYSCSIDGNLLFSGSLTGTPFAGIKTIWLGNSTSTIPFTAYFDVFNVSSTNFESTGVVLPANIWASAISSDPYHDTQASLTGNLFFIDGDGTVHTGTRETSMANLNADYVGYWSDNYLFVYSTSDPGTRFDSVEATVRRGGIFLNTKEYIEVNGIDLFYSQWAGVYAQWSPTLDNSGFIMRNCESAYHGYPNGNYGYGAHISYSNSLFENNVFHDCGRRGISLIVDRAYTAHDIIIQKNNFYNGYHTTSVDLQSSDALASSYDGVIIRNNIVDCTSGNAAISVPVGMFISNQSNGTINNIEVYGNIIKHSTGGGGLQLENLQGAKVYNNTFAEFDTTYAWAFHLYITGGCTNIDVKNNIFYTTSATAGFGQSIYLSETQLPTGVSSDYNLFYRTASNGSVIHTETADYTFADKAAIIAGLGWETHSVFDNPDFVSASDFHLQVGSSAINAGIDVGLTSDYDGNPIVGLPDIGAHEYQP